MYIKRHAEDALRKLAKMFGAVLVTGSRQVGKSTLLTEIAEVKSSVTLDDPLLKQSAKEQGGTFFKDNPPPVLVDEIQYAPNLFPYIKMALDKSKQKGQFYLTGSQQFEMMSSVTESLAGRIGILMLLGFSLRERKGVAFTDPFLPTDEYFTARKKDMAEYAYDEIWSIIHRGCMPEIALNDDYDWQLFFGSYVRTYLERDIRQLSQVADEEKFLNFMTVTASCTGQLLNLASLSRDVGVSEPTASRWLSILVTSGLVYLLKPYSNNITKRTVKTPKLYFLDTGLAAYLTRWNTPEVLKSGAMAGAFFESFVVAEIIKSYYNRGVLDLPLYFYRDRDMNEIDLIIEDNGTLYPLEIKKHADPQKSDLAAFRLLDKIPNRKRGSGGVICLYDRLITLQGEDRVIPVSYL
ncbi:MAG: ATP-binding protein [Oscillospiraceae bacterium]|jgi:predicted AAA+ superfamily ATPase|nr:ATP-binding protein [Oscillospiraceae bacterium]